jgi:hypothetical protein
MKTLVAAFWKHRWCRSLLWIALVFALACLHPFVRQSIFGPKIDGIPWCTWESRVRAGAHRGEPNPWLIQFLAKVGLLQGDGDGVFLGSDAALPLYVQLVEDNDASVRHFALQKLCLDGIFRDAKAEILPILRRHLQDDDPRCRVDPAFGVWRATQDRELWPIVVPLIYQANVNEADVTLRALRLLCEMAPHVPETFEPLAKLSLDTNMVEYIRIPALYALEKFGKRAIPVYRKWLSDPDRMNRYIGVLCVQDLGKDGAEMVPDLLALQSDTDQGIRREVAEALKMVDPGRFGKRRD